MIKHKEKIKIALIATILIAFTILIVPNLVVSFINETYRNQGSRLDNDGVGPIEIVDENTGTGPTEDRANVIGLAAMFAVMNIAQIINLRG